MPSLQRKPAAPVFADPAAGATAIRGTVRAVAVSPVTAAAPNHPTPTQHGAPFRGKPRLDGSVQRDESDSPEPPRVLVCEDDALSREVTLAMLRPEGFAIDTVATGTEAVAAVASGVYQVVLMDLAMPELNGLDATRRIRALPGDAARVPIIAMTAHALAGDRERCLDAGMTDYVSKPVNRRELIAVINELLDRSGRPRPKTRPASAASAEAEPSPATFLDMAALNQLERDTGRDSLIRLVQTFVAETEARVARIVALADREPDALGHQAHSLKSAAATFGARALSALAAAIERAAALGRAEEAAALASRLPDAAGLTLDAYRRLLDRLARQDQPR